MACYAGMFSCGTVPAGNSSRPVQIYSGGISDRGAVFSGEPESKHHYEYWIDLAVDKSEGLQGMKMPVRYVIEMFMDRIAASKVYAGKDYTDSHPLNYYKKSRKYMTIHPDSRKLLERLLLMLSRSGEEKTFAYIRKVVLSGKYKY